MQYNTIVLHFLIKDQMFHSVTLCSVEIVQCSAETSDSNTGAENKCTGRPEIDARAADETMPCYSMVQQQQIMTIYSTRKRCGHNSSLEMLKISKLKHFFHFFQMDNTVMM